MAVTVATARQRSFGAKLHDLAVGLAGTDGRRRRIIVGFQLSSGFT